MKRKVLLIYTGGTIGMKKDYETDSLSPVDFEHVFNEIPELNRIDCQLEFRSFKNPIDSSDMRPDLWIELAEFVKSHYNDFDGFVILHGSDTMAYTASALSFLLENLNKPVILTGSQLPIGTLRTDGKENLITSIEIAATYINDKPRVAEVAIYFEYNLYRGNRARKEDADDFKAFESPNYPLLAEAGVNIEYNDSAIAKGHPGKELIVHNKLSTDVAIVTLFPGINHQIIEAIGKTPDLKGMIIETFGSGNAPSDSKLLDALKNIINNDVVILNISQCHGGTVVQNKYRNGQYLEEIGVISGGDLTSEAALTKLMFLLGNAENLTAVKSDLKRSLRGEMSNL